LSGEERSVPAWLLMSESVGRSWLSGDAPWVAFTPAGDGPIERGVVSQFAEDHCWSVGSVVLSMSVLVVSRVELQVTSICGVLHRGSPIMWSVLRRGHRYMWDTVGVVMQW
jgi:hypothetical protein